MLSSSNGENEVNAIRQRPSTTPGKAGKTPSKIPKCSFTPGRPTTAVSAAAVAVTPLQTQLVQPATPSTNTRVAAIQAKMQATADRIQKVAAMKSKWSKEKEAKMRRQRERRAAELRRQQEIMLAAAEQRKIIIEKNREVEAKKKQMEKDDLQISLEAAAQLSKDLAEKMRERRRQSIVLNNEILQRAQTKMQELMSKQKQDQDSYFESKKEDFHAVRAAKKVEASRRRDSMVGRTEAARKLKETEKALEEERKDQEKSLIDFRYTAWCGEKEYKKKESQRRRESIAQRLDSWRNQKKIEESQREQELDSSITDFNLKQEDWRCVQEYKANESKKERESIQARLEKWRAENAQQKLSKAEESEASAYEFELRRQEHEDVLNYKSKLEQDRRQSLAYRLDCARKDKDWERGQATLLALAAEESRRLDEEDRAAVAKYKQDEDDARRESTQYRNQVEVQEAMRKEGIRKQEHKQLVEDLQLKHDAWLDVQNYQQSLRDERRKSIAMRLVHSRKQKEAALIKHKVALEEMHKEFELKHAGWQDVLAYESHEQKRRRDSVAMRLDSWRLERMQKEKERAKKQIADEEDAALKEQDAENIRAAREAMKDKEKMDMFLGKMAF